MTMPAIHAVFFDAVGTLIHPEPSADWVYADVGRRHGSRLERAAIAAAFRSAFRRQEEIDRQCDWRTSEERETQRWRSIVAEVLHDLDDAEGCFKELYAHFAQPMAWTCDPDAALVFTTLRKRGCEVGLASNYDHRLRSVVAGIPTLASLQLIVISSEVGWRKPSPHYFGALCRHANVPAAQVLVVGDDRENDYDGALAAGLQAVLFDPRARGLDAARRVGRLGEVVGLVDGSAGEALSQVIKHGP